MEVPLTELMATSDRPLVAPLAMASTLWDKVVNLNVAFKTRPLRDGGGKPSPGRLPPLRRPSSPLASLGAKLLTLAAPRVDKVTWSTSCGEKVHPFPDHLLHTVRTTLGGDAEGSPAPGQPIYLTLLHNLARLSGDPDMNYPLDLMQGVPLGVSDPPLASPGIWPLKSELSGEDTPWESLAAPFGKKNYSSAEDFAAAIRPMAAIDEGDKIRTIYDGSAGSPLATCCPGLWIPGSRWHRPCPDQNWVLLKADVTKAHRRIKILPKDWRFQVAELQQEWWINKVGTYGMASAQLYWGRLAALILRLLYHLFPQVDWGFVFVDDYCWILRSDTAPLAATTLLLTLLSLGVPLSWKKTHLAEVNTWLGFVVHPNTPQVQMAAPKHVLVMALLDRLIQGDSLTHKEIEKALGRVQWGTAVCPLTKSLLQPFWAWKVKLPIGSDNQGNVFALLNQASKKPYTAAVLMELVLHLHMAGCALAPSHVPRELNEWADELTHPGFEGFDVQRRLDVSGLLTDFVILPRLMSSDSLDFTEQATQDPVTGSGGRSCFPDSPRVPLAPCGGQGRTVVAAENFDLAHHTVTGRGRSMMCRAYDNWAHKSQNIQNLATLERLIQRVDWISMVDAIRSEFRFAPPFVAELLRHFDGDFLTLPQKWTKGKSGRA
eukprot:s192_g33.t1